MIKVFYTCAIVVTQEWDMETLSESAHTVDSLSVLAGIQVTLNLRKFLLTVQILFSSSRGTLPGVSPLSLNSLGISITVRGM